MMPWVTFRLDYDDDATLKMKKKQWTNIFSKWDRYSVGKKRNDIKVNAAQYNSNL